jgi:beta-barrel assembly-enhancing protease
MTGPIPASFYDGETAVRREVVAEPSQDGLSLVIRRGDGAPAIVWRFDRLRAAPGQAEAGRLTLMLMAATDDETPRDPARLVIADAAAIAWLRRTRPGLFRRDVRPGTARRVALWLAAAAAAVALMLFVILPRLADRLALWISPETEAEFGRAMLAQVESFLGAADLGALDCDGAEGVAALRRLEDRLSDSTIGYRVELRVMDHEMVNAFALPGGQVVILRGLLDAADGPDEVAGVLAHEIGHVAHRDPTRLMLRSAGSAGLLSLVFGDVTGGTFLALAGDHLLQASYTREAEAAADDYALTLLNDRGISSAPFADFFERIAGQTDGVPELLSSHPLSAGRADRARANAEDATAGRIALTPALTDADWAALKAICG